MGKIVKITRQQLQLIREQETNDPLSAADLGALELLHDFYKPTQHGEILEFLKESGGFDSAVAAELLFLFKNNYREDGDYEAITNPDRSGNPFIEKLKLVADGDEHAEDVFDEGELGDFEIEGTRWDSPTIEFGDDAVTITMPKQKFIEDYSKMGDNWSAYYALDGLVYGNENDNSADEDELNYIGYIIGDVALKQLMTIAEHLGDEEAYEMLKHNSTQDYAIIKFLRDSFPEHVIKDFIEEFLWGYETARHNAAVKSIYKQYREDYPFEFSRTPNEVEVTIPYDKLIEAIVLDPTLTSFSELPDSDLFEDDLDYSEDWSEHEQDADYSDLHDDMERNLQKIIDDFDSGELDTHLDSYNELMELLETLKFRKSAIWNVFAEVTKGDIYVRVLKNGIDYKNRTITIERSSSDNRIESKHKIPFDELVNYVNQADIIRESILNQLRGLQ